MAAPKQWGYTRDDEITDELLVSWIDGDLTAIVAKELEERLLADAQERADIAAFARAVEDSTGDETVEWRGKMPGSRKLHLHNPRAGLVDNCKALGHLDGWAPGAAALATEAAEANVDIHELPGATGAAARARWQPELPSIPMGRALGALVVVSITVLAAIWMINNL